MNGSIRYLRRHQVADEKWNDCIARAENGLVYGFADYLDAMADHWDALVLEDYQAVMPLPWRRKWGFHYLYPPFLTAQLGVFGNDLDAGVFAAFLQAVPPKFKLWDLPFNHKNLFPVARFPLYQRSNYVLDLAKPYADLQKAYRENIRRNVKKCYGYGCSLTTSVAVDDIIALAKRQPVKASEKEFAAFRRLYGVKAASGTAKAYGVLSPKGDLVASAVFLFSHARAYYILVGNHPNGRTLGASHALIDAFIKDHAGQNLLLDFEGSDLRNLAFFYASFGAVEERYAAIKLNRLPWWVKWMKE